MDPKRCDLELKDESTASAAEGSCQLEQTPKSGLDTKRGKVVGNDTLTSNGMEGKESLSGLHSESETESKEESDMSVLSQLLPLELWYSVLNQIEDNQLLENLSNASLVFRGMLSARRTQFLFPKVLELVHQPIMHDDGDNEEVVTWRLVCKKWNQAIERRFKEEFIGYYYDTGNFEDFMEHFKETHPAGSSVNSPFLNGAVHLDVGDEDWLDHVQILLSSYGSHICNLNATHEGYMLYDEPDTREYYNILCKWVNQTPFLKILSVTLPSFPIGRDVLLPVLRTNPFPYLNYVQKLDLEVAAPLFNAVLAKCQHVVKLGISNVRHMSIIDIGNLSNLQLKELTINYTLSEIDVDSLRNILSFGLGNQLASFKLISRRNYVPWSRVLLTLGNRCGKTLERLYLDLARASGLEAEGELLSELEAMQAHKYELVNLKHVTIKMKNIIPLDFLYAAEKTLETLELGLDYQVIKNSYGMLIASAFRIQSLRVLDKINSLDESNIWHFPSLESVKYSLKCAGQPLILAVRRLADIPWESAWVQRGMQTAKCTRVFHDNSKNLIITN